MTDPGGFEPSVVDALYQHASKVYARMFADSTRTKSEDGVTSMVVWEGHLTKLITQDLSFSVPYYTSITKALKRMGCIRQIRRGGGSGTSQWELRYEPTEELYATGVSKTEHHRPGGFESQTRQQLQDMAARVRRLEHLLGIDKVPLPVTQSLPVIKEDNDG